MIKEALDRAIALNPKLDFVSASQVNELSSIINAPRVIKPVEPESHWFIWLLSITSVSFVIAYFIKHNNKSSKLSTPDVKPSTKYSPSSKPDPRPNDYMDSVYNNKPIKPAPVNPNKHINKPLVSSRPAEVHHHHFAGKSDVLTTVATAGLTAAAVSYLMDDNDKPEQRTHSYQPEPISSSTSSTWDSSAESTSSSWNDDSSSSSDSWSDSSSNSDSSWND